MASRPDPAGGADRRAVRGERCGAGVALRRRRQLVHAAGDERPGMVPLRLRRRQGRGRGQHASRSAAASGGIRCAFTCATCPPPGRLGAAFAPPSWTTPATTSRPGRGCCPPSLIRCYDEHAEGPRDPAQLVCGVRLAWGQPEQRLLSRATGLKPEMSPSVRDIQIFAERAVRPAGACGSDHYREWLVASGGRGSLAEGGSRRWRPVRVPASGWPGGRR